MEIEALFFSIFLGVAFTNDPSINNVSIGSLWFWIWETRRCVTTVSTLSEVHPLRFHMRKG